MKSIVFAFATATALTGTAAFADHHITEADVAEIHQYAPDADVSTLSEEQLLQIQNIIHSGDSESEKRNKVKAYFESSMAPGNVVIEMPEERDPEYAEEILVYVPDADLSTLTEEELLQIENILHSSDSESEKRGKISAYFQ